MRLLDGLRHESGKDAKLTMGAVTAMGGGEAVFIETGEGGVVEGVLTSSDVISNCTIQAGSKEKLVNFRWDDFTEEGEWMTASEYLPDEQGSRVNP